MGRGSRLKRAFGKERRTHWRGLHYAIVARGNIRKPDGGIYRNTDYRLELVSRCRRQGRALAWSTSLRADHRQPQRRTDHDRKARVAPEAWVSIGFDVDIPDLDDIEPKPGASGFAPRQAFQFVIFGEKGSLEEVLLPFARTTRPTSTFRAARSATRCCTG